MNTFDCDGVITVGIYPGPNDVIITGRSFEEQHETLFMLKKKGIDVPVFFNPLPFDQKTRVTSGQHKANIIIQLYNESQNVKYHFEDDEVQKQEIERILKEHNLDDKIKVIHIVHDETEKENVRHTDDF